MEALLFHKELTERLESFQEFAAPTNGMWLDSEECKEDANAARITMITLLRWVLNGNPDATLRKALEDFVDALGAEWGKRPLPTNPHLPLKLVG